MSIEELEKNFYQLKEEIRELEREKNINVLKINTLENIFNNMQGNIEEIKEDLKQIKVVKEKRVNLIIDEVIKYLTIALLGFLVYKM